MKTLFIYHLPALGLGRPRHAIRLDSIFNRWISAEWIGNVSLSLPRRQKLIQFLIKPEPGKIHIDCAFECPLSTG